MLKGMSCLSKLTTIYSYSTPCPITPQQGPRDDTEYFTAKSVVPDLHADEEGISFYIEAFKDASCVIFLYPILLNHLNM